MAQIDDFFMYENRVEGITEAEDVGAVFRPFFRVTTTFLAKYLQVSQKKTTFAANY